MPALQTYRGEYLWDYVPNLPAAIAFAIIFTVATCLHIWKMCKYRLWFCMAFVSGGICEMLGYITRGLSYNATGNLGLYLASSIFLLLPAVLFAATLYVVYSRIVRALGAERFSLLSARRTTISFVLGDLVCLNIQSTGGGLLGSSTYSTVHIGGYIVVAGLILQIIMFAGFVTCCLVFHIRFRRQSTSAASSIPWQELLYMLYATSILMLVRNLYRVVEFAMGKDGYLLQNEWPVYAFDAALMLLVMIGFYIWYPSQLQPSCARPESAMELVEAHNVRTDHGDHVKP